MENPREAGVWVIVVMGDSLPEIQQGRFKDENLKSLVKVNAQDCRP
jgi:hypothetical protein